MTWYAVQLKAGQGDRAVANLQNQDIQCFYPKITVEKILAGKRATKLEPLFPGYLFIHMEQADPLWAKLRSTRGVSRVVSFGNQPAHIDDAVVDHIRQSLETVAAQGGIKAGDRIQLQEGPFRGLEAVFRAYDGEERAIVLIHFMQQTHQVTVAVSTLKP
ncbi:transcription/translation regulatory transformer protein RfaH [Marinobacter caseinilyticus]|uniref:transcription/translation regulatory transformer protein RfaH n=1 Tax=Marinobacter caseinilyticus TaxID=2692195 RepID=UPI00140B7585|nr:transcription/translation regulatory transformer protein RfaH [Marinobacter caseinilyticus]